MSTFVPSIGTKYKSSRVQCSLPSSVQQMLWNLPPSSNCMKLAGKLSLCYGMPILLHANMAMEVCITKGQAGVVHSWVSSLGTHGLPVLDTLFVSLVNPPATVKLDGLPPNVVPICRTTQSITSALPDDSSIHISRNQVEVLLNFAMTDYSSQGKTRLFNVCDLNNSRTHQVYYTALSRSSSARCTVILQGFDQHKISGGCSGALRQEYRQLELLDDIVRLKYESALPEKVYGDRRNTLLESFCNAKGGSYNPPRLHRSLKWSETNPFELSPDMQYSWNHEFKSAVMSVTRSAHNEYLEVDLRSDNKRKVDEAMLIDTDTSRPIPNSPSTPRYLSFIPYGPVWTNNSCAYDVVSAALFNIWQENPTIWHRSFTDLNPRFLAPLSGIMLSSPLSVTLVDKIRDKLRELMYQFDSNAYAYGQFVSVADIAEVILSTDRPVSIRRLHCVNGHVASNAQIRNVISSAFIEVPISPTNPPSSLQAWVDDMQTVTQSLCVQCQEHLCVCYTFEVASPLIVFAIPVAQTAGMQLSPIRMCLSPMLQISTLSNSTPTVWLPLFVMEISISALGISHARVRSISMMGC